MITGSPVHASSSSRSGAPPSSPARRAAMTTVITCRSGQTPSNLTRTLSSARTVRSGSSRIRDGFFPLGGRLEIGPFLGLPARLLGERFEVRIVCLEPLLTKVTPLTYRPRTKEPAQDNTAAVIAGPGASPKLARVGMLGGGISNEAASSTTTSGAVRHHERAPALLGNVARHVTERIQTFKAWETLKHEFSRLCSTMFFSPLCPSS